MTGRILLTAIAISVGVTSFAVAGGQSEDPIRRARELVSDNRLDDAILLLQSTVRTDPDRIREAEALMNTIREIRGEYNVLFEQLINNLIENPDDIERTLAIIEQMEALDEFPNERVLQQISDARTIAQLAFDRNAVEQGMDRAAVLIEQGQYREAIEVYLSLRGAQRDQFEARGYGDIFASSVNEAVAQIDRIVEQFDPVVGRLEEIAAPINSAASVLEVDSSSLDALASQAAVAWDVLEEARSTAVAFAVLRSRVPLQFPDVPVDWYLTFQEIIMRGRADRRGEEGIAAAIAAAVDRPLVAVADLAGDDALTAFSSAEERRAEGEYGPAAALYANAQPAAEIWRRVEAARRGAVPEPETPAELIDEEQPGLAQRYLSAHIVSVASTSGEELSDSLEPFADLTGDRADTLFVLQSRRDAAAAIFNRLDSGGADWQETQQSLLALPSAEVSEESARRIATMTAAWAAAIEDVVSVERDIVARIAELRIEGLPEELDTVDRVLEEVPPLLAGVEIPLEEASDEDGDVAVRIERYPDRALERVEQALARVDETIETATLTIEDLEIEPERVTSGAVVRGVLSQAEEVDTRARAIREQLLAEEQEANALIAEAGELEEEGRERVADTRAAIAATQAQAARSNYEAATEALFASLELREDPEFRVEVDEIIRALGEELQELENVIVVRRVRELITQADELYRQDEFSSSRDTLIEAEQTWFQTNIDPNPEIERLLQLVTAALTLEEGRELTIADPLYPILSNYLSVAREDFNRGESLLASGQDQRADLLFDRSIENLRNVRDVRPLNWDARLLELRITELRNPAEFDEIFATRYRQALDRLDEVGPLQVYSEIEVLAEINPNYPGIQAQLERLEIALNLRPQPVDRTQANESATLLARARSLAQGGSTDQVAVAVTLLEQAVELDPTNRDAAFLLDQLRIQLGGQATVALSTTDEQQYRRAETLFSQGQVLQALSIVERLLGVADNQSYPPLVELRRRIGLRLGI